MKGANLTDNDGFEVSLVMQPSEAERSPEDRFSAKRLHLEGQQNPIICSSYSDKSDFLHT